MKNFFVSFLFCIVSVVCFGQIIVKESEPKPKKVVVFDSTKNFLGNYNVKSYKGQILFVLPKAEVLRGIGYYGFKPFPYDEDNPFYSFKSYGRDGAHSSYTMYEDLAFKYFVVDSVKDKKYSLTKYVFYLTNRDSINDKCCFMYDGEDKSSSFPFLVLSHYNFLVSKCANKEYVTLRDKQFMKNRNGEEITIGKIVDITVDDEGYIRCSFITDKDTARLFDKFILDIDKDNRYIEKNEWDELVKKYGVNLMKCVLKGTIKVGMPVELLIMSWGYPDSIHSSSYYNEKQYVYGYQYVYVRNGKISAWQD